MKKLAKEFGEFIKRGNVIDMAVGVIIGGAFGKIVTALVQNIITPLISILTGQTNLAELAVILPGQNADGTPLTLAYGAFLQAVIDFLIIAVCIFLMIKVISKIHLKKKEEAAPEEEKEPEPTKEELLLTEIRDLLKAQAEKKE